MTRKLKFQESGLERMGAGLLNLYAEGFRQPDDERAGRLAFRGPDVEVFEGPFSSRHPACPARGARLPIKRKRENIVDWWVYMVHSASVEGKQITR